MNNFRKMMKRTLLCALTAVLCLSLCVPAFASTGDRILQRIQWKDGEMSRYIQNVSVTENGIYAVILNGTDMEFLYFADYTAEPEQYVIKDFNTFDYNPIELLSAKAGVSIEDSETGDGDAEPQARTQTVCWVGWNNAVYALQYREMLRDEGTEVEGGWLRKLVLKDGEARLEETDLPQLDWSLMVEENGSDQSTRYVSSSLVSGNKLYCQSYDSNGEQVLIIFDLTDGSTDEIPMMNSPSLYSGPEGKLLLTRYEWAENESQVRISLLDPEAQEEEEIGILALKNYYLQGLQYDPQGDRLILSMNGQLMVTTGMDLSTAEAVNDCPPEYDMHIETLPDGFVLLWNQSTIAARNTDPSQRSSITLNIQDMCGTESFDSAIYDFTDRRGDVSVTLQHVYNDSSVLQAMMNRDASVDIYTMEYQNSAFDAVRTRGFLTDLSGNEEIRAAADRMYPYVRNAITTDGKITMVPVSLYGITIGYNTEAWAAAGLTEADVPHTWDQLFDLLETLPAKVEGTEYSVFESGMSRTGFRSTMLSTIINQYQAYLNRGTVEYAFNTPLLRGLLTRLASLDYDALGLPEDEAFENGEYETPYRTPLLDMYINVAITSWYNKSEALKLSFTEGEEAILPISMGVAFVNPYSEHPEEAAEFLAASLRNLPTTSQYNFFTDKTEPVRYPDFEETKENLRKWLDEAQAVLKTAVEAGSEETADLEQTVQDLEKSVASLDDTYWMIAPQSITSYQERTPWIEVLSYDFSSGMVSADGSGDFYDLSANYASGSMSAEELLSTIDKKVQMMRLEGN